MLYSMSNSDNMDIDDIGSTKGQYPPEQKEDEDEPKTPRPGDNDEEEDTDRPITSVPPIPRRPLNDESVFDANGMPDLDLLRKHFLREGRLEHGTATRIIQEAAKIFKQEPNLLRLHDPITGMKVNLVFMLL